MALPKLQWDTPHNVTYAIPDWLRDHQVQHAISLPIQRIQADGSRRSEPAAVVCFGPSLQDTWEKIRDYKVIFTCSGAHQFLIERGIIPNYHVAVDPLPKNTVGLIGQPHPDTTYLIASTCHSDVFEHLKDNKVQLWHVFDSKDDAIRLLPSEEWAFTGGANVGLRALVLAHFFGYTDIGVFGMDGCYGKSGSHAGEHPHQHKKGFAECEYDGVKYITTISMLECAKMTPREMDMLPEVNATFYGDGLVQHMMRNHKPTPIPKDQGFIAFSKPSLISPEYKRLNQELFKTNSAYGVGGDRHADLILKLAQTLKSTDVLDYGSGRGRLARAMPFHIQEYDPCVPGKDESPKPADLCVTTDVLEHIEPDRLDHVLADLKRCTKKLGLHIIFTQPSTKVLANGMNAHLIQEGKDWWVDRLSRFFTVEKCWEVKPVVYVLVSPLKAGAARSITLKPNKLADSGMVYFVPDGPNLPDRDGKVMVVA